MSDNIPFSDLDFDSVKRNLKQYLASQSQFKDYDFEGSNINVLLDVLAYNTFQNNYYSNMVYSEMFLDSAQLIESGVSHAKELNYLPKSRSSASADLDVVLTVSNSPSFVTIPKNTKFSARCGSKTFNFFTDEAVSITPDGGIYRYNGITVHEGTVKTELYKVTGDSSQYFDIHCEDVDINSIEVHVRDNVAADSSNYEYMFKPNLFGVSATDKVFYVTPALNGKYRIEFGIDKFGKQPLVGNVIKISYRSCSGAGANGASNFTIPDKISGYTASVTSSTSAAGGSDKESLESIKYFAPKSIQVQDRAITETDYEILLKNRFSEIQAISVYGGEELTPPRYGSVVISVDVANGDGVSENNKNKYIEFLKERVPIGITPMVTPSDFMHIKLDVGVAYDIRKTKKSAGEIRALVQAAIMQYNTDNLGDFKRTMRHSKLVGYSDAADSNILSVIISPLTIIPVVPVLNINNTYDLNFNNELEYDSELKTTTIISDYEPAISSSPFKYNGDDVLIHDDGKGALHIIRLTSSGFAFIERNIGTVDYTTGRTIIKSFNPTSFDGSEVKIIGKTKINNITSPKNRILSIRDADITINVSGVNP